MAIISSIDTSSMVIDTINSNVVVINMPPTSVDVDVDAESDNGIDDNAGADAVSKLVQLALGSISVGNFSAGSAGVVYRDHFLAGSHGLTYEVAFIAGLGMVYLAAVGQVTVATRLVSMKGDSAAKMCFVSFLMLMVIVIFAIYYHLNNQ